MGQTTRTRAMKMKSRNDKCGIRCHDELAQGLPAPLRGAWAPFGRLTQGGIRGSNLPWADTPAAFQAAARASLRASLKGWCEPAQGKRNAARGNRVTTRQKRPEGAPVEGHAHGKESAA